MNNRRGDLFAGKLALGRFILLVASLLLIALLGG